MIPIGTPLAERPPTPNYQTRINAVLQSYVEAHSH